MRRFDIRPPVLVVAVLFCLTAWALAVVGFRALV